MPRTALHTGLTIHRQAPEQRAPNEHGAGAQCQRFQHIRAPPNAAIEVDFALPVHRLDDLRQHLDTGEGRIQLPSPMVGNDDRPDSVLGAQAGVFRCHNALDDKR